VFQKKSEEQMELHHRKQLFKFKRLSILERKESPLRSSNAADDISTFLNGKLLQILSQILSATLRTASARCKLGV